MGLTHTLFSYFRYIHISYLGSFIDEKNVSTFYVAVDYFVLVKRFQPLKNLIGNFPNIPLLKSIQPVLLLSELLYFRLKITTISVLHDYTQRGTLLIKETSFVANDIGNLNRGK